jgi:hypothetical protein
MNYVFSEVDLRRLLGLLDERSSRSRVIDLAFERKKRAAELSAQSRAQATSHDREESAGLGSKM